jgi:hypothetical protein
LFAAGFPKLFFNFFAGLSAGLGENDRVSFPCSYPTSSPWLRMVVYPYRPIQDLVAIQFQSQSHSGFDLEIDVTGPSALACYRIVQQINGHDVAALDKVFPDGVVVDV